jgi:hypothetical protein
MQNEFTRTDLEKILRNLVDNQEMLEASMKPIAELMHAKLTSLMVAGFTREEAMDLLKTRGLNA